MKMPDDLVDKLRPEIGKRLPNGCSLCNGATLTLLPVSLMPNDAGGGQMAQSKVPVLPVRCEECGHIVLFDAQALGAV